MWGNNTANKHARFNRLCMSNLGVRCREIKQKTNERKIQCAHVSSRKEKKVNHARIVNHFNDFIVYNRNKDENE